MWRRETRAAVGMTKVLVVVATAGVSVLAGVPTGALAQGNQGRTVRAGSGQDSTRSVLSGQVGHVSTESILSGLGRSGMTRAQVRAELQRMGYDPGLADRYFAVLEGRQAVPIGPPPPAVVEAMGALGVPGIGPAEELPLTSPWIDGAADGELGTTGESMSPAGPRLFGLDLFRRYTTQFEPVGVGPVDPDYEIGPGDEVSIALTGEIESSYLIPVDREGRIQIPEVGSVFVAGLTLTQLEDRLYGPFGQRYAGLGRDTRSPIRLHASLGRLRTSVVYVVGEVVRPGAYEVSSIATALSALYRAGGPNERGSFRSIEVRRSGSVASTIDLYDYLLHGFTERDVRLHHGDVVFVPMTGPRVSVEGAVRRQAIFEVRAADQLADVLEFAGGLASSAATHRVQLDRILPPELRRPGIDRALLDVSATGDMNGEPVPVRDGDVVRVFEVASERRNRVVVTGQVNRPGDYEWIDGLTLGSLLERSGGVSEQAYAARAHIFRLNPYDQSRALLAVALTTADTPIMDRDSVVVYSASALSYPQSVAITGYVKRPGRYPLARGMTLQDLVLAAGGFAEGAYPVEAELARQPASREGADGVTVVQVRLGGNPATTGGGLVEWSPNARELRLADGDQVFIRKSPDFDELHTVRVAGQVEFPGVYALAEHGERVSDLLARAGGPTVDAEVSGARLIRGGHLVATDVAMAIESPGSPANLSLLPGDSLFVPRGDPTVHVTGAVGFETRVRYVEDKGIDYYIDRAGGYTQEADRGRTTVTQQNGERRVVHLRRFFFDSKPTPGAGSTIFVPAKPASARDGFDWDGLLTRVVGVASAAATVIIAADRIGG